jgi:hypothetical protein
MGNSAGLYRRGGLSIEKVAPVAIEVTEELFPGLLSASYDAEEGCILWSWAHAQDRSEMGEFALAWWQYNGAKVGGKHIRAGEVGYWIMAVLENNIAARLPGNVRLWDEGVGKSWEADPAKYPTLWVYLRSFYSSFDYGWPDLGRRLQVTWKFFDHGLHGLDPKHHATVPDWVKDSDAEVPSEPPDWFEQPENPRAFGRS